MKKIVLVCCLFSAIGIQKIKAPNESANKVIKMELKIWEVRR